VSEKLLRKTVSAEKRKCPGRQPSLKTPENIEQSLQAFVRSPPLADNKGSHLTDTIFRK
jgi:hypothetical protein